MSENFLSIEKSHFTFSWQLDILSRKKIQVFVRKFCSARREESNGTNFNWIGEKKKFVSKPTNSQLKLTPTPTNSKSTKSGTIRKPLTYWVRLDKEKSILREKIFFVPKPTNSQLKLTPTSTNSKLTKSGTIRKPLAYWVRLDKEKPLLREKNFFVPKPTNSQLSEQKWEVNKIQFFF